jgi:hypothetical protein
MYRVVIYSEITNSNKLNIERPGFWLECAQYCIMHVTDYLLARRLARKDPSIVTALKSLLLWIIIR